jgi:hypothetical protein
MNQMTPSREEFLVSVCFATDGNAIDEVNRIPGVADILESKFRYWEIVYVLRERQRSLVPQLEGLLSRGKNVRVIVLDNDANIYQRRAIAASEAIGDVVVLTSFSELEFIDLPTFAQEAHSSGQIVIGRNASNRWSPTSLHWLLALVSSYRINDKDLQTIALPRTKLNALVARSTFTLDLRFEPKFGERYARRPVATTERGPRRSTISDRYELLEELISTSSPRILRAYAALSTVVAVLATLYGLYAVVILLLKSDVQAGWFSTAIVQSGSVAFIAMGMTTLAIGVADIAERLQGRSRYTIVDEMANLNLFDQVKDVNVDLDLVGDDRRSLIEQ